jgi:2-polyprenyl-3-methyl-5-hydroxy-6-metoxy-1,4-benzoquinol methylase
MTKIRRRILLEKEFNTPGKPAVSCTQVQLQLISEFNNKVKNGLVNFETVPCLCGFKIFDAIARVDRYGMLQDTVMCVECGLVQSNPRMTKEEYLAFYSTDLYRACYDGEDYLNKYEYKFNLEYGRHILDEISKIKYIGPGTTILEIGAGGGWNLLPFLNAGAKVLGIDYSPTLTKLGNKHGIPMKQGSISDISGEFDIIIMNHALEHFLNPIESLRQISQHLKNGGVIYIAVPNILNFSIGQLQNAHTYYFTPFLLEWCCAQAGLKLISMGKAQNIHQFGIFRPCVASEKLAMKCKKTKINFFKVKLKTLAKRFLRR